MEPMTMAEKLQTVRERYWLLSAPLLMLIGVGLGSSALLFWVAIALLLGLTLNKVAPLFKP